MEIGINLESLRYIGIMHTQLYAKLENGQTMLESRYVDSIFMKPND